MDYTELVKAAAGTGAWGLLALFLIKYFIDDKAKTITILEDSKASTIERLENSHKETMVDMKNDKDKLMEIVMSQKELLTQQKEILSRQTEMLGHNEATLGGLKIAMDKIIDIQLLHANRLEKIEDRLERVERQTLRRRSTDIEE